MEKHGVCQGEEAAPKTKQADARDTQASQACGRDQASKLAEQAARPADKDEK